MANPKRIMMTTPEGTLLFPSLNQPNVKFNPEGVYEAPLILRKDAPETVAFLKKLDPFLESARKNTETLFEKLPLAARKKLGALTFNPPYSELFDDTTEEPTGEIKFNFKLSATWKGKDGKTGVRRAPPLFDASNRKIVDALEVGSGTRARVSFNIHINEETGAHGYFIPSQGAGGISLKLAAVQIIELRRQGEMSAEEYGFEQTDGYQAPVSEESAPFEDVSADSADF